MLLRIYFEIRSVERARHWSQKLRSFNRFEYSFSILRNKRRNLFFNFEKSAAFQAKILPFGFENSWAMQPGQWRIVIYLMLI